MSPTLVIPCIGQNHPSPYFVHKSILISQWLNIISYSRGKCGNGSSWVFPENSLFIKTYIYTRGQVFRGSYLHLNTFIKYLYITKQYRAIFFFASNQLFKISFIGFDDSLRPWCKILPVSLHKPLPTHCIELFVGVLSRIAPL